ncbi:Dabb family protein [Povalibacter sp.]|uniref:Dabb family protein n=1 Tax=Povalibacter sp. TaxID=1962978 RepID=UPI002F41108C
MNDPSRRTVILSMAALTAGAAGTAVATNQTDKRYLVHHALFWLKRPGSREDRERLIAGLKTLRQIDAIRELHIGVPANTEQRDVVDASFDVSEVMLFDDEAAQSAYQKHPVHRKFVEDCSSLWQKVVVYDAIDV